MEVHVSQKNMYMWENVGWILSEPEPEGYEMVQDFFNICSYVDLHMMSPYKTLTFGPLGSVTGPKLAGKMFSVFETCNIRMKSNLLIC